MNPKDWNAPPAYVDISVEEYAHDLLHFMIENQWIWKLESQHFLKRDSFSKEPLCHFLPHLTELSFPELQRLLIDTPLRENWHPSFLSFVTQCRKLAMHRDPPLQQEPFEKPPLDRMLRSGMGPKKCHEVDLMTSQVHNFIQHCPPEPNHVVVDIGCGKGYLSQALADMFRYRVIGVEGAENIFEKEAKRRISLTQRANKHYWRDLIKLNRLDRVDHFLSSFAMTKYWFDCGTDQTEFESLIHETLHQMNSSQLKNQSKNELKNEKNELKNEKNELKNEKNELKNEKNEKNQLDVSIVGLHCCGNLSYMMLKLFCNWKSAQRLINVGCCFDKLFMEGTGNIPFPMSSAIKKYVPNSLDPVHLMRGVGALATEVWHEYFDADYEGLMHRETTLFFRSLLEVGLQKWIAEKKFRQDDELLVGFRKVRSVAAYKDWPTYLGKVVSRVRFIWKTDLQSLQQKHMETPSVTTAPPSLHSSACRPQELFSNWDQLWRDDLLPFLLSLEPQFRNSARNVSNYLALQYLIAPVAESLILLDRYLYLVQDAKAQFAAIVPIFNPHISSRNLALFAHK